MTDLRTRMKLNCHYSLLKAGRLGESLQEHRALVAAITARRGAEASRLMRAHFANGLNAAAQGADEPDGLPTLDAGVFAARQA